MTATVTDSPKVWSPLRIGGGGFISGINQHTDGTLVCRTDTYGEYLWNASTSEWEQLMTSTSMPVADVGVYGAGGPSGCYEIMIAPSDSDIFYKSVLSSVYKSTNRGTTWVKTAFTTLADVSMAANGPSQRIYGPHMAIDPINADVVYMGTQDDGLFHSLDGGASWTVRTDVPVGTVEDKAPGVIGIIVNPASSTVSGRKSEVWASSYGNGYYRSTDGGVTWSKPSGGPATAVKRAEISPTGILYCVEYKATANNKCWKWNGSWTEIFPSGASRSIHCIAIDPFDETRLISATDGGELSESTDSGATWGALDQLGATHTATAITWHALAGIEVYFSCAQIVFDKVVQNRLLIAQGIGVWYVPITPGALQSAGESFNTPWVERSKGIEQLVAIHTVATPATVAHPSGNLVLTAWDRALWTIDDVDVFPSAYYGRTGGTLNKGWGLDYCASDPDVIVAVCSGASGLNSSYTENGGTTWTKFTSAPSWSSYDGGAVSVGSPTNWVWAPPFQQPYFTTNKGVSWTAITRPSEIANDATNDGWAGIVRLNQLNRNPIAADRTVANKFYMFHTKAGMFTSTDSGATWTNVYSGIITGTLNISGFAAQLRSVEGHAGHLWLTCGDVGGALDATPVGPFLQSDDGGVTCNTIPDVLEVYNFGFGKAAPGASYPTLFISGYVNNVYGIYYSTDKAVSWTKIGNWLGGSLDKVQSIDGDKEIFGRAYVGFKGMGWVYTAGESATISGMLSLQFRF